MKKSILSLLIIVVVGGITLFFEGDNSKGAAQVEETYSISGRVTDKEGYGLYGVTITLSEYVFENKVFLPIVIGENSDSALTSIDRNENKNLINDGIQTVTNKDGYYSFTDLTKEAYSIEPLGNDFLPTHQIVTDTGNDEVQDFKLKFTIPEDMVYVAEGEFWMGCDPEHN